MKRTDIDKHSRLKRYKELKKNYSLLFYKPYAKQREFHDAGSTYRERLLMAGNQLGKCITKNTPIDTPSGPIKVKDLKDGDTVYAWDGSRKVWAVIAAPIEKPGLHQCYRIVMSDGRFVECADHHRILSSSGWIFVSELISKYQPAFSTNLPPSSSESALSAHPSDALHWMSRAVDFLAHYLMGCRLDGELPPSPLDTGPAFSPSPSDAPQHNSHTSYSGDLEHKQTNIPLSEYDRPSSLDVLHRFAGRFAGSVIQAACRLSQQTTWIRQAARPLSIAGYFLARLAGGFSIPAPHALPSDIGPWSVPDVDGTEIIAVIPVGFHQVYDFMVPRYANYCAGGLIHHNTYSAGFEVAMHATGIYPEWWAGRRFEKATRGWVAGLTAEMTRDGAQRILMGPIGMWGTGCIPKELIVEIKRSRGVPDAIETVLVKNIITGDVSQITFKAYSDGREAFQSETLDWLWLDEEPPEDVYTEGITRTNATTGPVFMTFTPLLGMSNVVLRFWKTDHPDRHITHMTIDDVEHYTADQKRQIIDQYPEHEREARTMGIPMLGSGRVFPVAEEIIRESPLSEIPAHWKQIIGMDFGWDHPTTAVHLAYDPDTDCIHVTKCYRQSRQLPVIHATAVKPWGEWIPVAWPRDALQHDKGGSCEQLKQQYHDHGLKMLSEPAAFPDKRGFGVEAGVMNMLERMQTGRFKVDVNLNDWWEEFRMYHRKDGQIIKEREDLICATRYATMMLRYAMPQSWAPKPRDKYARDTNGNGTWMSG